MNKIKSFQNNSGGKVTEDAYYWIRENPNITIISHSHAIEKTLHYFTIIYTEEENGDIKL